MTKSNAISLANQEKGVTSPLQFPDSLHVAAIDLEENVDLSFDERAKVLGLDPQTDFKFADLTYCDFTNSDLRSYDFTGSDLTGVTGINVTTDHTTVFDGAITENSIFDENFVVSESFNTGGIGELESQDLNRPLNTSDLIYRTRSVIYSWGSYLRDLVINVLPRKTETVLDDPKKPTSRLSRKTKRKYASRTKLSQNSNYHLPTVDLLESPPISKVVIDHTEQNRTAEKLRRNLAKYKINGKVIAIHPGPVVTLFEFDLETGVKPQSIINVSADLAQDMNMKSIRIAAVPDRKTIGIELPNRKPEVIWLKNILKSEVFMLSDKSLPLIIGTDIGGNPFVADLTKMPHLLVAGSTGSGKSVSINAMILSLMYTLTPEQCRFIMIDPKMLELSVYNGCSHLLTPVIQEPKKAVVALKWTVREMEDRYRKMSKMGVRNMAGYNEKVLEAKASGEVMTRTVMTGYNKESGEPEYETEELNFEPMPFIVVIIDEMADLMMVAKKDIEGSVQRLAQMARAAGIHMIMATQRPSVDVITGTIKANFPTRISFRVGSKIDSRTIIGEQGAEQLLGNGDMLFMGTGRPRRFHGPFVSDGEVERIANFVKAQGAPKYLEGITTELEKGPNGPAKTGGSEDDSLFNQAVAIVVRDRKASTSYIQRRLSIGYNRAADLVERMEEVGIISSAGQGGKRKIFISNPDD